MKKREAKFSEVFRHWIRANPQRHSNVYEVKQTIRNSIPFEALEPQQIDYGNAIEESNKGVLIRHIGGNGEPDYIYLKHVDSWIVIKFPDFFCLITLTKFCEEKHRSKSKSLTAERAKGIAEHVVPLKGKPLP